MDLVNHQWRLAARPSGLPKRSDWNFTTESVPDPDQGKVVVQIEYISLDPAMRGWMNEGKSYIPPVGIGEVMRAGAVGHVIASKNDRFATGDSVVGMLGVQEYAHSDGAGLNKIDPRLAPLPVFLGVLGMPGMTAYFGLLEIGQPKAGETVVVSAAAGAVGGVVGQIAKIRGCRTVGIAGGSEKCNYVVNELGFDACIDYKQQNVYEQLKRTCPNGIDVYFDNVGGDILDAALANLRLGARIPLCGGISQYNNMDKVQAPKNYLSLLINRAMMKGFIVFDFADRYAQAASEMAAWLAAGKLKHREHIVSGLQKFPEALLMLFKGENNGKLILKATEV